MKSLLLLCMLAVGQPIVDSPGVIIPEGGLRERAAVIEDNSVSELTPPDEAFTAFVGEQLPPSDRGQFSMVAYVSANDPESRRLLVDLDRHPSLKKLKAWCKFTVIDKTQSIAAEARHAAAMLKDADVPTLLIFADPRHPVFGEQGRGGWRYAFQRSGYGGDAGLLARNIYAALVKHYQEHGVEQCPGPYCPYPQPQPEPDPWRPNNPSPQPDWDTPSLPSLDEPVPSPWNLDLPSGIPWDWVKLGAVLLVLYILWIRFGRPERPSDSDPTPPAAGVLLLAVLLACSPAVAEEASQADPPNPEQRLEQGVETYYPDDESLTGGVKHRPVVPRDWAWLVPVVRTEVRRALEPVEVEGFLFDSWNRMEVRVLTFFDQMDAKVSGRLDRLSGMLGVLVALAVLQLVGIAALIRSLNKHFKEL